MRQEGERVHIEGRAHPPAPFRVCRQQGVAADQPVKVGVRRSKLFGVGGNKQHGVFRLIALIQQCLGQGQDPRHPYCIIPVAVEPGIIMRTNDQITLRQPPGYLAYDVVSRSLGVCLNRTAESRRQRAVGPQLLNHAGAVALG